MAYNLNDHLRAHSVKMTLSELEEFDFRMDELHVRGERIGIQRKETWGKMFRDPVCPFGLIQGFDSLGFRFIMEYVRYWTVGRAVLRDGEGKAYTKFVKPIAKMVHFIWHGWEEILPEFKDEYNLYNPKDEEE